MPYVWHLLRKWLISLEPRKYFVQLTLRLWEKLRQKSKSSPLCMLFIDKQDNKYAWNLMSRFKYCISLEFKHIINSYHEVCGKVWNKSQSFHLFVCSSTILSILLKSLIIFLDTNAIYSKEVKILCFIMIVQNQCLQDYLVQHTIL